MYIIFIQKYISKIGIQMNLKIVALVILSQLLISCAVKKPTLAPNTSNIEVNDKKPAGNYEIITSVSVTDGMGCKDFGYLGNKEDAMTLLKNKAQELNGTYAHITSVIEPHLDGGCYDNKYTILAIVYKKSDKPVSTVKYVQKINTDEENFTKKMRELKSLLDDGVLTQKEYETQKSKLLEVGFTK